MRKVTFSISPINSGSREKVKLGQQDPFLFFLVDQGLVNYSLLAKTPTCVLYKQSFIGTQEYSFIYVAVAAFDL